MSMLNNAPLWQLVQQSDWVSKYVVLLGLGLLSVLCIAVAFYKFMTLNKQIDALDRTLQQMKHLKSTKDIPAFIRKLGPSFPARLLRRGEYILSEMSKKFSTNISDDDYERLELSLSQKIDDLILEGEDYLSLLGTSSAVAPLIGLFGTVWGLIHAFINISQEKIADIAVVAPGIAEALITTLAGLIVAIPALVFFNYFSNILRRCDIQLTKVSDSFLMLAKEHLE